MKANSDELQSFVSTVDSGSISAAAKQMGLTASAISRALSRLEHKLGTALLNRATRCMELTEEGRYFLDQVRQILQQMETLEERLVLCRQSPAGRLRINAASPFMPHAVVSHTDEFRRLYSNIQFELSTNDLIIDPLEQRTDVVIRIDALSDFTLHARPLGVSRLHIFASLEYLVRRGMPTSIEGLRGHTLLGFTQPEHLNRWLVVHADDGRLEIQPDISAPSGEVPRQLALSYQGIACLTGFTTDCDIQDGYLVPLFVEQTSEYRQPIHAVYYRNSQLALRIRCFLDLIQ